MERKKRRKEGRKREREGGREEEKKEGRKEGNWAYLLEQKEKCRMLASQSHLSDGVIPLFRASVLRLLFHLAFCIRVCGTTAFTQLLHGPRSAFLCSLPKLGSHFKLAKSPPFLHSTPAHHWSLVGEVKLSVGRVKGTWLHSPIPAYAEWDREQGKVLGVGEGWKRKEWDGTGGAQKSAIGRYSKYIQSFSVCTFVRNAATPMGKLKEEEMPAPSKEELW